MGRKSSLARSEGRLALGTVMVLLGAGAVAVGAGAKLETEQPGSPGSPVTERTSEPSAGQEGPAKTPAEQLAAMPPNLRIGARVAGVHQRLSVVPTLVLVPDASSYAAAIAGWTTDDVGAKRFPVLIDRGTFADQERIARFVRGFKPTSVVRWKAGADAALPADRLKKQAAVDAALVRVWGGKPGESLKDRLSYFRLDPPGMVVAWGDDPAWTAGIALAAGRGELLAWISPREGHPGAMTSMGDVNAIRGDVDKALEESGYSYKALGDTIEGITLCVNMPGKVLLPDSDKRKMLATTDLVGRDKDGKRFAWCGQIFGDEAQAAYMAMCALFLPPVDRAWFFDGYDSSEPWVRFDATTAAERLAQARIFSVVDDAPGGMGLDAWRKRAGGVVGRFEKDAAVNPDAGFGVDARFISVTTSGNPDFFELKPGIGHSVDVPFLRRPSQVVFVHSWSAYTPNDRKTIGAVWLERGAAGYVGSVHEPLLSAFVPPPVLVNRLFGGFPWGVATRIDNAEAWKVAVYGDPLWTYGPAPQRIGGEVGLAGAVKLDDLAAGLVKERKMVEAVRVLALLGRDRDATRLLGAVMRDQPGLATRELAMAGIGAAFQAGDLETLLAAARLVISNEPRGGTAPSADVLACEASVRDMVWHAVWPLRNSLGMDGAEMLTRCLRSENLVEDTRDVVEIIRSQRLASPVPRDVVIRAQKLTSDRKTMEELDKVGRP